MKSKNDKTNPFPGRVTFSGTASDLNAGADRRSAAHKMLSLAINTAQKNIRFTTDLTKLGTLKNEETNPTFQSEAVPEKVTRPGNGFVLSFFDFIFYPFCLIYIYMSPIDGLGLQKPSILARKCRSGSKTVRCT